MWPVEHKSFRHSSMRSGSSSSSSRFKIRPKQVNASTCDFDRVLSPVWRQHRDTLTRFEESYMSTKATAARIYEYGEPDVFRFETMDVPDPVDHEVLVRNPVIGLNFVDIYYRRGTLPQFLLPFLEKARNAIQ